MNISAGVPAEYKCGLLCCMAGGLYASSQMFVHQIVGVHSEEIAKALQ